MFSTGQPSSLPYRWYPDRAHAPAQGVFYFRGLFFCQASQFSKCPTLMCACVFIDSVLRQTLQLSLNRLIFPRINPVWLGLRTPAEVTKDTEFRGRLKWMKHMSQSQFGSYFTCARLRCVASLLCHSVVLSWYFFVFELRHLVCFCCIIREMQCRILRIRIRIPSGRVNQEVLRIKANTLCKPRLPD